MMVSLSHPVGEERISLSHEEMLAKEAGMVVEQVLTTRESIKLSSLSYVHYTCHKGR